MPKQILALSLSFLAAVAFAADSEQKPNFNVSLKGEFEHFRRLIVNVTADASAAGKTLKLKDGDNTLGKIKLAAVDGRVAARMVLPLPAAGKNYGVLNATLDGDSAGTLKLPDFQALRQQALRDAPILFKPCVFTGSNFPRCDFEQLSLVEDLVGEYSLQVTFYDAAYNEVKSADRPGRYGAIVTVNPQNGAPFKRFITLYRQPEQFNWWRGKLPVTAEFPKEFGVSLEAAKAQAQAVSDYFKGRLSDGVNRQETAILLAGLSETAPGTTKVPQRESASERDRRWWFDLRAKTGNVTHRYLEFLPRDYDKDPQKRWPLVLFLHGSGERGDDLEKVKIHGPPKLASKGKDYPFILIAPQCPDGVWWLTADLNHLLDEVSAKFRVDPERIYVTGLSMGGFGTWQLAMQYPQRFAAIAPICGGGDADDVERIKHLPVWIFHGAKDSAVPVKFSEDMEAALKKAGGNVKLTIYPEANHDSWTKTYDSDEFYTWLLQQKRSP
ncbi:MAG TPA: prolyl oligopeptidase family serine peptidase [Planctomycetota bacterium]|jgi:pimeloyl-ACP methyl ester carboxylesterase